MKWACFLAVTAGTAVLGLGCAGNDRGDGDGAMCAPECTAAQTCCGSGESGVCTFLDTDPRNCGGCGIACGAGERCNMGTCAPAVCEPACVAPQLCCSGVCAFTGTDTRHCGGCGIACAAGQTCMSGVCTGTAFDGGPRPDTGPPGMCMPTCSSAQRCCGTSCVGRDVPSGTDGRSDSSFMNCNGCGLACDPMRASSCSRPPGGGAAPQCMCGNFRECMAGEVCANSDGMLRCISLESDPENCGEIGNACGEGEICRMRTCSCGSTGAPCPAGSSCCGGMCLDTSADNMNCGGCGTVCPMGTTCSDSMCLCGGAGGRACRASTMTDPGELCCADTCVAQDAMNCGSCGTMCDEMDGEMCVVGMDFFTMTTQVCCSEAPPFPGFPAFCPPSEGGGSPDGGFPFPP